MEATEKIITTANNWYNGYVEGALTTGHSKFWLVFWRSVVVSCATYYTYAFYISDYLKISSLSGVEIAVVDMCALLPFVFLRRLQAIGFLLLCSFLTQWLGLSRLAFWLLILIYVAYRKRSPRYNEKSKRGLDH